MAVASIVAGSAASAVFKMLGGAVPGLMQETRRKREVRRSVAALSERPVSALNDLVERMAPDDVATLVAYVGLPDFEQLAIQLTGAVLEDKKAGKYESDLRAALVRSMSLHGVTGSHDVATVLFDELWAAVVETIGEIGQGTGAAAMMGTTLTVSMRAAAAARNCQLLERLRTLDDVHAFIRALRMQIERMEGFIRPPNTESGRRLPLVDLYVEPHLVKNQMETTVRPADRFTTDEILAGNIRTVVLGDPGGGKSTMAAAMVHRIASSSEDRLRHTVPLLVVMRDYAESFKRERTSLARYLHSMVAARYQVEPPTEAIEFVLLNGCGVLIFDGLDELIDTSLRRTIVDAVEAFAYAYPTATIVVTSRRIGYEQAPVDPSLFTVFRLTDFDDEQIWAYSQKWFSLDPTLSDGDRGTLTQSFVRESEYADDLRRNPLMLALMCALYRGEGYIPRNRLDVYERCSMMLFERWDRHRGIAVPLPFQQHVRPALYAMAEWMFTGVHTRPSVTEHELVSAIRLFLLGKRFDDFDEADAAATTFVDYCRGRAWVLTDVGTTRDGEILFAFTHRTFLEYFTANQIVRTTSGARALLEVLLPHIYADEWEVVAQLSVLLIDRYVDGGADDFLKLLIRDVDTRAADERIPGLTFAARLLTTFVPSPSVRRRLFDVCWDLASSLDGDVAATDRLPWTRLTPMSCLLASTEESREPTAALIRERIAGGDHSGISALLAVTMDQLLGYSADYLFNDDMRRYWYAEAIANRMAVRATFRTAASRYTWAAVEATYSGDLSITELIDVHGAAAVCEAPPVFSISYRRAPIIQQQFMLACDDLPFLREESAVALDPRPGPWTDELARALPVAPTPWARLSRLPCNDMDVVDPTNTISPGTAAFDVMVLCACLYWEGRMLLRQDGAVDLGPEPLPSWLRQPADHPMTIVITAAATSRYGLSISSTRPIPENWLSTDVRAVVDRWATTQIDLVVGDS